MEDPGEYLDSEADKDHPAPQDYIIQPDYSVAQQDRHGILLGPQEDRDECFRFIMEHSRKQQFWPDVWFLDDHGGLYLFKAEEYPRLRPEEDA